MSSKANLVLGALTALFAIGYISERKRACIHHKKHACRLEAQLAGTSAEGCEQEAKKFCKLFGVL